MQRFLAIACLITIGVVGRLIPHLPNATPITAITIAAGRYVGRGWTIGIPLTSMVLADLVLGFYDWRIMLSVYGSIALLGTISLIAHHVRGIASTSAMMCGGALVFFFITNGAVWAFSPWFEKSISGLLYAYELGLPFLRSMILGDMLYTPLIVGVFEYASFLPALRYRRPIFRHIASIAR